MTDALLADLSRFVAGDQAVGPVDIPASHVAQERDRYDDETEDFVQRIAALTGDGVDAVFDSIGGEHLRRSRQTLRKGGTLVSVGASGDVDKGLGGVVKGMLPFTSLKFRPDGRRVRLYLITATPGTGWKNCRDDWAALVKLKLDGKLHPIVGAELPLSDVRRAHEMMDRASVSGKLVLVCN